MAYYEIINKNKNMNIINKIKNWWFAIVGIVLILLDQGFEVVNPLLIDLGISGRWIGILKVAFAFYGIYKLKKQLPTQNPIKLQEIIENKVSDIGGSNPPPEKDDK